jgi:hypothetical protein
VRQPGRADINEQTFELCGMWWSVMQVTICEIVRFAASAEISRQSDSPHRTVCPKVEVAAVPAGRLGYPDINGMEQR